MRLELELRRRRDDAGLDAERAVTPVLLRRQFERRLYQLIPFWIVPFELFARRDRVVIPVVDAVAVEVRLADLGPVFTRVAAGIGVLPEPLVHGLAVGVAEALSPAG